MGATIAVIGAGAVGLACAAVLARRGHVVYVIERHARVGQETSSRNSEVIHAGLYYPVDSLKARACVAGRSLLVEWLARHRVGFRRVGKLVIASQPAQERALEELHARGRANGAGDLRVLDARELVAREPHVRGVAALWSPESGVFDVHGYMESLRREALDHGASFVFHTQLVALEAGPPRRVRTLDTRGELAALEVDWVVNAAGLSADKVAALTGVDVAARQLTLHPCKGDYFALSPRLRGRVQHLIYPLPEAAGLGIHLTLDLAGNLRAGPDACYVDEPHYQVQESKTALFAAAVRRYLPELELADLSPAYAGIRPKLQGPGQATRDFFCEVCPEAPRVVQLVGIESPGLTASLALANVVAEQIER